MNTCKTCKWWSPNCKPPNDLQVCNRGVYVPGFVDVPRDDRTMPDDGLRVATVPMGRPDYKAVLFTGPEFGCVHWKPKSPTTTT